MFEQKMGYGLILRYYINDNPAALSFIVKLNNVEYI